MKVDHLVVCCSEVYQDSEVLPLSFELNITENSMTEDLVSCTFYFISGTSKCGPEFWLCLDFAGAKLLLSGHARCENF